MEEDNVIDFKKEKEKIKDIKEIGQRMKSKIIMPQQTKGDILKVAHYELNRIKDNLQMLRGDLDANGVDWEHFDFMMCVSDFGSVLKTPNITYIDVLKYFWAEFYPYLDNVYKIYEEARFEIDVCLKRHVNVVYREKLMEKFLEDTGQTKKFEVFQHNFEHERKKEKTTREDVQEEGSSETKFDS